MGREAVQTGVGESLVLRSFVWFGVFGVWCLVRLGFLLWCCEGRQVFERSHLSKI